MAKCVYWALVQSEHCLEFSLERKNQLEKLMIRFMQSEDKTFSNTCREIYKVLYEPGFRVQQTMEINN